MPRRPLLLVIIAALLCAPAEAPARVHVEGARTVTAGATVRLVDVQRNARARTRPRHRRVLLLSRDRRRDATDTLLARRPVPRLRPGRRSRRTVVALVPARLGSWRVLSCPRRRARRCDVARGRLRIVAPPPARPPAPPPLPEPPAARIAAAPPAPPVALPAPAPEPEPDPSRVVRIRECGLPADPGERWAAARTGWSGGDATYSVPLPDGRRAWLFGDTFIGGVRDDGTRDPASALVRNSLVVEDGDCLETVVRGSAERPRETFLSPGDPHAVWYWPAQPVVRDGALHVFLVRVRRTGDGSLDFAVDGAALATLSLPDLALQSVRELPARPGMIVGAAALEHGGETYLLAVDDPAHRAHVARLAGDDLAGPYEFWDGTGWTADPAASAPVLDAPAASQLSLLEHDGHLVLVQQPPLGDEVVAWRADAPQGPWTDRTVVATLRAPPDGWTYNALVHPDIGLSYNVNGVTFGDILEDAALYRPRFITGPPALP